MNFLVQDFCLSVKLKFLLLWMCKNLTFDPKRPYGWTRNHETYRMIPTVREPGASIGTNFGSKAHSDF